jgi:hypothetical protein
LLIAFLALISRWKFPISKAKVFSSYMTSSAKPWADLCRPASYAERLSRVPASREMEERGCLLLFFRFSSPSKKDQQCETLGRSVSARELCRASFAGAGQP